jgi:hypothetical protein
MIKLTCKQRYAQLKKHTENAGMKVLENGIAIKGTNFKGVF